MARSRVSGLIDWVESQTLIHNLIHGPNTHLQPYSWSNMTRTVTSESGVIAKAYQYIMDSGYPWSHQYIIAYQYIMKQAGALH